MAADAMEASASVILENGRSLHHARPIRRSTQRPSPSTLDYHHFLVERDGELNIAERTLSRRERSIKKYETPPKNTRAMGRSGVPKAVRFLRQGTVAQSGNPALLALVKLNGAEAYGVRQNFQRALDRALKNNDEAELRILCEEGYHTRILLSAANRYGIEVKEPYHPPSALRVIIGSIATAPMTLARPLTLCEIIATLMFVKLLDVAPRVETCPRNPRRDPKSQARRDLRR